MIVEVVLRVQQLRGLVSETHWEILFFWRPRGPVRERMPMVQESFKVLPMQDAALKTPHVGYLPVFRAPLKEMHHHPPRLPPTGASVCSHGLLVLEPDVMVQL